jgi:hypothetical protein
MHNIRLNIAVTDRILSYSEPDGMSPSKFKLACYHKLYMLLASL